MSKLDELGGITNVKSKWGTPCCHDASPEINCITCVKDALIEHVEGLESERDQFQKLFEDAHKRVEELERKVDALCAPISLGEWSRARSQQSVVNGLDCANIVIKGRKEANAASAHAELEASRKHVEELEREYSQYKQFVHSEICQKADAAIKSLRELAEWFENRHFPSPAEWNYIKAKAREILKMLKGK